MTGSPYREAVDVVVITDGEAGSPSRRPGHVQGDVGSNPTQVAGSSPVALALPPDAVPRLDVDRSLWLDTVMVFPSVKEAEMARTTKNGEIRARTLYSGDWDEEGTVAAYLPRAFAERLLTDRGWLRNGRAWDSPSGERYWETDEALQIALVAEVA